MLENDGFQVQLDRLKDPVGLFFWIRQRTDEELIVHPKSYYVQKCFDGMKTTQRYEPSKALHGTDDELMIEAERRIDERWESISNPPALAMERASVERRHPDEGRKKIESNPNFVRWYNPEED